MISKASIPFKDMKRANRKLNSRKSVEAIMRDHELRARTFRRSKQISAGRFCTFVESAAASQKFPRLRSPRMGNCTGRDWRDGSGGGGGGLRSFLCSNALSNIPQALSTRQEMIGEFAYSR